MGHNQKPKYTGKPIFPYVAPMVPQTAAPAVPEAPVKGGPMFNFVPRYTGPVQAQAQPMRQGQPTRHALKQIFENKNAE